MEFLIMIGHNVMLPWYLLIKKVTIDNKFYEMGPWYWLHHWYTVCSQKLQADFSINNFQNCESKWALGLWNYN